MGITDLRRKNEKLYKSMCEKGVIIFGAGTYGRKYLEVLQSTNIKVLGVWDNNPDLYGEKILDAIVEKPHFMDDAMIIVAVCRYQGEIIQQLKEIGIESQRIVLYEMIRFLDKNENRIEIEEKYPDTIQFPITYKCNFNCIMCGMNKLQNKKEMNPDTIRELLKDDYYSHIHTIGINGGEPFLRQDIVECVDAIMESLEEVKRLNIISNGYFTNKIVNNLKSIKKNWPNVFINLAISIDALYEKQDFHRGKKDAFISAQNTINEIRRQTDKCVDNLELICTITKENIWHIYEVDEWATRNDLTVNYNIASPNERIKNMDKVNDFCVQNDLMALSMAKEFFYGQYLKTGRESYFAIFLFLMYGKRYALCPHRQNEWVTVLPDGDVEFCAARSKPLGNGILSSTSELIANNQKYFQDIKDKSCDGCSSYMYMLNDEGLLLLHEDQMKNQKMRYMGEIYGM